MQRSLFVCALAALVTGCSDYSVSARVPAPELEPAVPPTAVTEGEIALGGVRGRVCAPDGVSWVSAADVSVMHAGGISQTLTDGNGWFLVDGIPTGTIDVQITKGSFSAVFTVDVVEGQITELPQQECLQQGDTRIAVVTGEYDHIQEILDHVGLTYDTINGIAPQASVSFLRNPSQLAQYDVIFFNCGMSEAWIDHEGEVANNIRNFVQNGGSIYASDWSYYLVEASFRDQNRFHGDDYEPGSAYVGMSGMVTANVLSPSMQQLLGSTQAQINYDLDSWAAMVSSDLAEVLIEGQYTFMQGWQPQTRYAPLASRFDYGMGTVIYTSFHNEQQTTFDMDLLLEDIVLSL